MVCYWGSSWVVTGTGTSSAGLRGGRGAENPGVVTAVAAQAAEGSRAPGVSAGGAEQLVALADPGAAGQRSRDRRCGRGKGPLCSLSWPRSTGLGWGGGCFTQPSSRKEFLSKR